jgi:hypothetical protein
VLLVVALAAGIISGIRLYFAGKDYAAQTINDYRLTVVIGICTFLAAELLVILATVASQIYMRGFKRWLTVLPIAVGMAVAFVGNWEITNPTSTWGWVETLFPPVAVLSVAFLFEISLMPALERQQSIDNAYQTALSIYNRLTTTPASHEQWANTYGWALWEMWGHVFGGQYDVNEIDRDTRQLIALREMDADHFFSGNLSEISQKRGKRAGNTQQVSKKDVIEFLKENPEAELLKGIEIAEQTGASPATVSRALKEFSRNGHG